MWIFLRGKYFAEKNFNQNFSISKFFICSSLLLGSSYVSTWHFLLFFKDTHSDYRNDNIILSLGPIKVHLIIVAEVLRSKQIIKNPQNLNIENIYSSFKGLQIKKVLNVILKACEKQMDKSQFSNSPLLTLWRMPGCISWIERRHIISKYLL